MIATASAYTSTFLRGGSSGGTCCARICAVGIGAGVGAGCAYCIGMACGIGGSYACTGGGVVALKLGPGEFDDVRASSPQISVASCASSCDRVSAVRPEMRRFVVSGSGGSGICSLSPDGFDGCAGCPGIPGWLHADGRRVRPSGPGTCCIHSPTVRAETWICICCASSSSCCRNAAADGNRRSTSRCSAASTTASSAGGHAGLWRDGGTISASRMRRIVSKSDFAENSGDAVMSSHATTPAENTSDAGPIGSPSAASGDMYPSLPFT